MIRPRFHIVPMIIALALAGSCGFARAAQFEDQTCPNVTPLGIKLNAIVDASTLLTPDLIAAANAMVDGYRVCMKGYDDNVYNQADAPGSAHTNGTEIGRIYSRLGLARSLERLGEYAADEKRYGDAKAAYVEALAHIGEMETIAVNGTMSGLGGETPEHRLLKLGDQLKTEISASLASLPSASPAPKPT